MTSPTVAHHLIKTEFWGYQCSCGRRFLVAADASLDEAAHVAAAAYRHVEEAVNKPEGDPDEKE